MYHESRIKKTLLNARINTICYFLNLIISFFSRKVFIDRLGADFLGLQGTLSSLLGFLNIAELGIGAAISYVLYKPLYDSDKEKINEIVSVLGYLYRWIGNIILGAGIILSLFLPLIFPNTIFDMGIIYLGFYTYLFSSILGYFVNYKTTLLSADQRNYEVTGYYQIVTVITTLLQMLFAWYISDFVIFFTISICSSITYSIILNYRIKKVYPWLETDIKSGRKLLKKYPDIFTKVKQLFVHKIGEFVQFQLTPFLIYGFVSLPVVALYNNYTQISSKLSNLINGVLASSTASVGNLIAEGNSQKTLELFKELFAFRFWIAGVFSSCVYYLSSDFISVWLGKQYVLSDVVVALIAISFFANIARNVIDQFKFGFGLFSDVWSPIAEACIFVAASVLFGSLYGLSGILMGPLLSMALIVFIWKPYFVFSKGFHLPVKLYWTLFFRNVFLILLSLVFSNYICTLINIHVVGWGSWILKASIYFCINLSSSLLLFTFFSKGMKGFILRLIASYKNKHQK